jgi:acyl-CoA synthetase (NDP forming)
MVNCAPVRDLRPLFQPRSIAVVGASDDPAKWGQWIAAGALRGAHRRDVYLVNRTAREVQGHPAFPSVADLPESPELVVVAVPAATFEEVVEQSLAAGAKAIVAISAGLGETGEEGLARERAVVERVRAAGAMLLGPNCLGVYDAAAELDLGANELRPGSIGLISQSGNLALEISLLAADAGLGFSRFASTGNQADLEAADLLAAFAAHEPTKVIAAYCEDFRDGRAFAGIAAEAKKPVVLLTAGGSEAGARAALSHTGALVSDAAAVAAACRAAGMIHVETPKALVDAVQLCLARQRPRGRRLAVVGDGGGHGVVAADVATAHGLEVPALSDRLRAELAAVLPETAATANPVDFAGGGEQDFATYGRVPALVLGSGEVDSVVLTGFFGGYSQTSEELAGRELEAVAGIAGAAAESGRSLLVQTMYPASAAAEALRAAGVPVYREIESAIGALAQVVDSSSARGVPALPTPAEAVTEDGYFDARQLLADAGVPFADARRVESMEEAFVAAQEVGYPVAVKALGFLHKSDAGGVALGLADEVALADAVADMYARLTPDGYAVEAMADLSTGVELIVGCRRDPRFGPLLLVGLGGIYAELLRDVAVALAPVGPDEAEELLRSLRGAALLLGARGRPTPEVRAAAEAASALSRFAAAHPEVAEVEVNPLLVTPDGALGLDARLVLA